MDNSFENIIPWNGANDTGRDVRLKWERNFAKIGLNFAELAGKFTTVDEMFDLIAEELTNRLRKDQPDEAAELITFLKGIISEDTSYISQLIVGGTSDTVSSGLTEVSSSDDTDVVAPSLQETASEEEIDGSTLGGLTNVNEEVDVQDAQDVFLVKSAGSDKWGKRNVKDFTGKDGVIAYPTMFLNPLTGRLILQVPTNNYENRFAVRNGHLMLIQS